MGSTANQLPSHTAPPVLPEPPAERASVRKRILGVTILAVLGIAAYQIAFGDALSPSANVPVSAARLVKATTGPIERTIRVTGQTAARNAANVTAPRMMGREGGSTMAIMELAKGGDIVKKGDVVVRFDPESLREHVDDLADTIQRAQNDIVRRRDEQAVEWENLQQSLRVAKAALDKTRLDARAAQVRTTLEQELLRLAVEEAEVRNSQLVKLVPFRREVHERELRILSMTLERHTRHRNRHLRDLERFNVQAPMDGMVVIQGTFRGGEFTPVQLGDQVAPGQPILKVVDPRMMQVEATVNQAQAGEVRLGQPVRVGFDGVAGLEMTGKVIGVGALAVSPGRRQNYYIRQVPLRIEVDGFDKRVLPDLSAWGEILIESTEGTRVPRAAVIEQNGRPYVMVRAGEEFEKREVELGLANDTHVTVTSGVNAGEEVKLN